jgi:hypothetical protein
MLSTMTVDKDTTDYQSTTGTGICGANCNTDNMCCGLGLNRSDGSEIQPSPNSTDQSQLLPISKEGNAKSQGLLLKPGSQGFAPSEDEMPPGQEPDACEIVLEEEDEEETKPKNGFWGGLGSRKSKSSLAAAATEKSNKMNLGGKIKRGNIAVIETDDALEAQTVDEDISIVGSNGTRVTLMQKPRSRRRYYIMLALLFLTLLCAIAALLVGLLKDRTTEKSLESSTPGDLAQEDGNDGDITANENAADIFEDNGGITADETADDIFGDKSSLTTGCFQYAGGVLVCLTDEGADGGLCSVTVDGDACNSCTVCDAERGTVRVDCSNVVEDLLVINDACIDTADAFDGTLLEAFLVGNDGGFEGSMVDPAGQGEEEEGNPTGQGEEEEGNPAGQGEEEEGNPAGQGEEEEGNPDDGDALGPNYTTGCFDYNFRLNTGAVVCLFDEDPTDDVCSISVDGQDCDTCTVCDRDAGTVRADCSNLNYSPVINDACSSDNSVYQGSLLEAFIGDPEDANINDGEWVDASEVTEAGEVCEALVESDFTCYARGASVDVSFVSCEFDSYDWIGIFPDTADPSALGTQVNDLWFWACDSNIDVCDVTAHSAIYTFPGELDAGSYKAFLIRRKPNGLDEAYSWSDAFEVKDNAADCALR